MELSSSASLRLLEEDVVHLVLLGTAWSLTANRRRKTRITSSIEK